jgi:hypothetical protein
MRQANTTFPKRYCAMPTLDVTLSLNGWFESASANGHRACIQVRSKQKSQFHKTRLNFSKSIIYGIEVSNITTDVNSIMKVKEYRFHIPIHHIFCELQFALQWVNCRDWTRFPDTLRRHPSYGQVGSPSNPELYGNSRMPAGHSRRTTERGRVECR